jgi:hypothetical protein
VLFLRVHWSEPYSWFPEEQQGLVKTKSAPITAGAFQKKLGSYYPLIPTHSSAVRAAKSLAQIYARASTEKDAEKVTRRSRKLSFPKLHA